MILSMTGFAAVAAELPGVSARGRAALASTTATSTSRSGCPTSCAALESALRERIARGIEARQGRMPDFAQSDRARRRRRSPVDADAGRSSSRRPPRDVPRHAPGAAPLSVAEILRWPGVLAEPTRRARDARRARRTDSSARRSPSSPRRARREGAKLAAMLEERCAGDRGAGRARRAAHPGAARRLSSRSSARGCARPGSTRTRTG